MYRHNQKQLESENFGLPFSGRLRSDNRRVKLAEMIPWCEFEINYAKSFKGSWQGPPARSVRVAPGALIIKERPGASDGETVEQIRENPYLQYFSGFKEYREEEPFHPTMFVHFRKRISREMLGKVNEAVHKKAKSKDDDDEDPPGNKGKLLIDATCAPAEANRTSVRSKVGKPMHPQNLEQKYPPVL